VLRYPIVRLYHDEKGNVFSSVKMLPSPVNPGEVIGWLNLLCTPVFGFTLVFCWHYSVRA